MDFYTELENVISDMPRIGLEETGKVRLMNRTDRKYLANRNLLLKFLRLTKDEYSVLVASESPVSVYSTTYWDTDDHQFYTRHHNGCRPRTKVRVNLCRHRNNLSGGKKQGQPQQNSQESCKASLSRGNEFR